VRLSVGDLVAMISLVLVSNAAIWFFLEARISKVESANSTQRIRMNDFENGPQRQLAARVEAITGMVDSVEVGISTLRSELSALQESLSIVETSLRPETWKSYVDTVRDCFDAIESRLEWHLAWLDRLSDGSDSIIVRSRAIKADRDLRNDLLPRLHELGLYSPDGFLRLVSAQSLADGTGDHTSLKRILDASRQYPDLASYHTRLLRRLSELGVR